MASLYKKVISGKPYWYLREMGWVDGKPKMVSERYVGSAAEVEALLDAREQAMLPERTRHLDFGAVAAAWGLLADLGVAAVIDEETGARPPGLDQAGPGVADDGRVRGRDPAVLHLACEPVGVRVVADHQRPLRHASFAPEPDLSPERNHAPKYRRSAMPEPRHYCHPRHGCLAASPHPGLRRQGFCSRSRRMLR